MTLASVIIVIKSTFVVTHALAYYVQKQTSTELAKFKSPFVHHKKAQSGVLAPPSTPTNHLATKTDAHKLGPRTEDGLNTQKKESRRRKKFCPVDDEISLHRHDMKAGISDVKVLTRTVNLRAAKVNHVHVDRANRCSVLKFYSNSYQSHLYLRIYSFKCTLNQVGMITWSDQGRRFILLWCKTIISIHPI